MADNSNRRPRGHKMYSTGPSNGAFRHGLRYTSEYKLWVSMVNRCYCPTSGGGEDHKNYAQRGIVVCNEWRSDPVAFIEWVKGHGYRKGLMLDRIDNDGPYSPENCRFVTCIVSNRNRRGIKLNESKVSQIKSLIASGVEVSVIAEKFQVLPRSIRHIREGRQWAEVK